MHSVYPVAPRRSSPIFHLATRPHVCAKFRWDPARNQRETCRVPPLPPHRERHPAYFYPSADAARARVQKLREQGERLETRKARIEALSREIAHAKGEVDVACANARSDELRAKYGADILREAREAAKNALAALLREQQFLSADVARAERAVRALRWTYLDVVGLPRC